MTSVALHIGRGELAGVPDQLANRMMMAHGSRALLRAINGEPVEALTYERPLPPLAPKSAGYVRVADRPARARPPAAQRILEQVAEAFQVSVDDILGRDRRKRLWIARTVAARLMRDLNRFGDYSTAQIGAMMANRDHSTICNALEAFEVWADFYPEVRDIYDRLSAELGR